MINIAHPIIEEEEKQAVLEVLDSGNLAQGSRVKAFEETFAKYCGTKHAIATTSGTTALHTALLAHGIGPGDEVITSAFTFIATTNAILYTGAKFVFVDIDPATFNLQPELIEAALTPHTKAILPVHLFGLSCNMDAIQKIASRHNLIIIEDACQSHGASYKDRKTGTFGTGAFSFYATKNMTSGEGGMITTSDDNIAERCQLIRQHGMRQRYSHEGSGYNYCMSDIHASIGLVQLGKLERFNNVRRENAKYFNEHLKDVVIPYAPEEYRHVYHQYTIRVAHTHRHILREHLQTRGIGSGIYYPIPLHRQPCYKKYIDDSLSLPQTELATHEVLSLPVHPRLGQTDIELITDVVNKFIIEPHSRS